MAGAEQPPPRWADVDRARLEQLLASGQTPDAVAAAYGRSGSLVRLVARRWGLDPRSLRARSTGLSVTHPSVAAQFIEVVDGAPAGSIPSDLASGSGARCRWRCSSCRHEWVTSVVNRTRRGSGCPECARVRGAASARRRPAKTPSIGDARPDLAAEFVENLTRADRDADSTPCGSHDRVLWRCVVDHSWETTARQRVKYGTQCPVCLSSLRVSRLEHRVAAAVALATGLPVEVDAVVLRAGGGPVERIDLVVDDIDLYVDLDPTRWHAPTEAQARDARKVVRLAGRRYVRIRPRGLPVLALPGDLRLRQVPLTSEDETDPCAWAAAIISVICSYRPDTPSVIPVGAPLDDAVARADERWRELRAGLRGHSLLTEHPEVAAELVGVVGRPALSAAHLPPAGDDRGIWRCGGCGGTYEARVANRTRLGTACPSCSARRGARKSSTPAPGTSFADVHPQLVGYFLEDVTAPGRTLSEMKPNSIDRCLWTCPHCGQVWTATPHSLNRNPRRSCRACSGRRSAASRAPR
ncbi:zinc-ribbon domain-containing protein [Klenkia terrae]|uniref:zinc-ribbon domain-containing protein n=1 Tax=Klenkia terrae TaxID=1052259 RepID=UPI003AF25F43